MKKNKCVDEKKIVVLIKMEILNFFFTEFLLFRLTFKKKIICLIFHWIYNKILRKFLGKEPRIDI